MPNEGQIQFADSCITIDNRLTKLLEFLCLNPGLTHTRDELIEEVWSGSVLTDQVVTQAVFELRKVLKTHSKRTNTIVTRDEYERKTIDDKTLVCAKPQRE